MIFETSAPYILEQNSYVEQQGYMLATKAHTMHIAVNLLQNL